MRKRIVLVAVLILAGAQADVAYAQFSPRGIMNMATRPLRQMLGRLGHVYGSHHRSTPRRLSRGAATGSVAAATAAAAASANPALPPSGPAAWPNAFETVVGYAFWPNDYAAQFRGRGFDVIAAALIGPSRSGPGARTANADTVKSDAGDSGTVCGNEPDGKDPWPIPQLSQTEGLTDAQHAALDKLRDAVAASEKTLLADCRAAAPANPIDRLGGTIKKLWAVRDAAVFIRDPLKDFYASLTDDQKTKFVQKQPDSADAPKAADKPSGNRAADSAMARQYQMCAAPSLEASERMVWQIAAEVRPRKEQNTGLDALRKTSADMAKLVTAACAQPIPEDPVARLDAASDQLSTMSYAASSLNVALNGFYAQLDSKQKAKFNALDR